MCSSTAHIGPERESVLLFNDPAVMMHFLPIFFPGCLKMDRERSYTRVLLREEEDCEHHLNHTSVEPFCQPMIVCDFLFVLVVFQQNGEVYTGSEAKK